MADDFDQDNFEQLFRLLEPKAKSLAAGFQMCRLKLVKFFAWKHCADPEDLADETITRLIKNIANGQQISSQNPYSYVYAISGNVFKEYARTRNKMGNQISLQGAEEPVAPDKLDESYSYCLDQLEPLQIQLLSEYYIENSRPEDIARRHNLSINALRLQIHRIKQTLRRCKDNYKKQSETKEI